MPFATGWSKDAVRTNIAVLRRAGYTKERASAAAFDMARRAKKRHQKRKRGSRKKGKTAIRSARKAR